MPAVEHGLGELVFAGQAKREGPEGGIQRFVARHAVHRVDVVFVWRGPIPQHGHQPVTRQRAACFPLVERIGVMGQKEGALFMGAVAFKDHRGRELAQDRGHWPRRQPVEMKALRRLCHFQNACADNFVPIWPDQPDRDRDHARQLLCLARCGRRHLSECQGEAAIVPVFFNFETWCPRVFVPAFELTEIAAGLVFEDLEPVLNRRGITVMALKVKIERV